MRWSGTVIACRSFFLLILDADLIGVRGLPREMPGTSYFTGVRGSEFGVSGSALDSMEPGGVSNLRRSWKPP